MRIAKSVLVSFVVFTLICVSSVFSLQIFDSYIGYQAGSYPYNVAYADLNHDTYVDLVVVNPVSNNVSVLLGDGDGTFAPRVHYSTGSSSQPYNIALGDMNGDNELDIVSGGNLGIVVLYGNGDGTFGTYQATYIGQQVLDVVLGDFNEDTRLDVITSHAVRDSIGIHFNNGDSTFTSSMMYMDYNTVSLAAGYIDGDAHLDLMVGCSVGWVWKLTNDGSGNFTKSLVHSTYPNSSAFVELADIDGNSSQDLIIGLGVNDTIKVYLNTGSGSFIFSNFYFPGDNPTNLCIADVNADDQPDMLVSVSTLDEVLLYLNQGSGLFAYDTSYSVGGTPKGIACTDLDGDTYNDLIVASYTTDMAAVLLNRLSLVLSIDDITPEGLLPDDYILEQNYPNPFNPSTNIQFSLPRASHVKVEVFNILGQSVSVLVDQYLTAGVKEIQWDGRSTSGEEAVSGMYFYRITTDTFTETKKMVLMK